MYLGSLKSRRFSVVTDGDFVVAVVIGGSVRVEPIIKETNSGVVVLAVLMVPAGLMVLVVLMVLAVLMVLVVLVAVMQSFFLN